MPPSSRLTRFSFSAHLTAIRVPTAVEPVKAMQATSGSSMSGSPMSAPVPVTTFTTPAGRSFQAVSHKRKVDSGVSSLGLMTTVLPAAIAGATFQVMSRSG